MLRETVEAWQQATSTGNVLDLVQIPPGQYTLANLAHDLPECESLPQCHVLEVLSLCLKKIDCTNKGSQDKRSIQQIASYAVKLLGQFSSPFHSVDSLAVTEKALGVLKCLVVDFAAPLDEKDLVCIAAYTDSQNAWTTTSAASSSEDVLSSSLNNDTMHKFIASTLIERFIRPVFSRTASNRITSTGRKAYFINDDQSQVTRDPVTETTEIKPWKSTQIHAITVFAWAVKHSSEHLISKSWPLFTPVLLALVDDAETKFKKKGLLILRDFLSRCPPHVIGNTGLGEIFEQSVFPSLLSLPGVTPEDEALQLLGPAYDSITELAQAWSQNGETRPEKTKLLVKVLREGVLAGYWHASEYVGIVELLAQKAIPIISQLGPYAVPHLKELLSMFSAIMTDPFLVSCPTCIQASAQALSTVMLNCWPRITQASHLGVVLRTISICWLNIQDENIRMPGNTANEKALAEVTKLAPMLSATLTAASLVPYEYYSPLLAAEPRLAGLFGDAKIATEAEGEEHNACHLNRLAAA